MEIKEDTYHHKDLKKELMEAGINCVAKEGVEALSLRKLAGVCGVSHAALYTHFTNKDDFLEKMQNYITENFSKELEKAIAKSKSQESILMDLGKAYLHFFVKNHNYFVFLFGKSNIALDLTEKASSEKNYRPFEIFKSVVIQILSTKNYPKEKWNDAIISLWAFIHGITALATMENIKYNNKWVKKLTDFMQVFECSFLR
jgi:AcrR family transcriptional regulator